MTALTEFFCDYCNPGGERRDGDDITTGYARELYGMFPLGWWEVPGKGPGGVHAGHCCSNCVLHNDAAKADIARRRGAETQRLLGELGDDDVRPTRLPPYIPGTTERESDEKPAWPSRTSPFGG